MPFSGTDAKKEVEEGLSVIREERILAVLGGAAALQISACRSLLLVPDRTEQERFLGICLRIQGDGPIQWLPSWPKTIGRTQVEKILAML